MITFRQLTAADFPVLHEWLQRPHVADWWSPMPTPEELVEAFTPMTDPGARDKAYVAFRDDQPIGYIQSYVVQGAGGGWWEEEQDPGARGIDQFLAHANQLGRGIGTEMVRAFVARLFADPAVTRIQTDPNPRNARAIRCYEKAGFAPVRQIVTPDGPALLMICERTRAVSG